MTLLMWMWMASSSPDLIPLKSFEVPDGDHYLSETTASCFADNGKLYVIDASQTKILVWNEDGSFHKGFGARGEGPGELLEPIQVASRGRNIYVWQRNGRMTRFNEDGAYQASFSLAGPWPRRFAMLDEK